MKLRRLPQLLIISILMLLVPSQTTLAQQPCQSDCLFRFVVYGDTRNKNDTNTEGERIHAGIVAEVIKFRPAIVLQTGDLVLNGNEQTQWTTFDKIIAPFKDHAIAYFPAHGNHDKDAPDGYQTRVRECFRPGGNKRFYAFDRGNVRFIAIDTEAKLEPGQPGKPGNEQFEWLKNELTIAKNENKIIIPFFHQAIYSVGHHSKESNQRSVLEPLFRDSKVKLVFQGHDHIYYHTTRNSIEYVVAGGGGAPLNKDNELHLELKISGDEFQQANNFIVCDVYANRIVVTTYSSLDPLKSVAYTQFKQFTVAMTP